MLHANLSKLNKAQAVNRQGYIPPDEKIAIRLQGMVEMNFMKQHDPHYYCREMGMNIHRLNDVTRWYLKKTVYMLIQDRIHQEALRLLDTSKLSVKQICYELGVSNPTWFGRCFKKVQGCTPKTWRRRQAFEATANSGT